MLHCYINLRDEKMNQDILNIGLGFLEGIGLIISPCILPILPIILAGSLEGDRRRPFGIIIGFVLIFALFTFFSKKIVEISGVDLTWIRNLSFVLLLFFGIIMISDFLSTQFSKLSSRLSTVGSSLSMSQNQSFVSGLVFGALIALVWTPCAGPILATVIVQTIIQQTQWSSFLVILSFGIGAALPMLLIALFGRTLMYKLGFIRRNTPILRKILGVIIILSTLYLIYTDGVFPSFAKPQTTKSTQNSLIKGIYPYPAPELVGISDWINSKPLELKDLKGKVVLVDFWTYSCINCVLTFPYLNEWYKKYHEKGFEIIGVHSPEFEFEKDLDNVKRAVERYEIRYPVALDNLFLTFMNFQNKYWPAHYLINQNGEVVYTHFGEGEYDTTENNIRFLLGLNKPVSAEEPKLLAPGTPETYLGYARANNYAGQPILLHDQKTLYSFPLRLNENEWALEGEWKVGREFILSEKAKATIKIHFNAKKVFVVMGNKTAQPIQVKVLLNGKHVVKEKGKNVVDSSITVKEHDLYEVIVFGTRTAGILQLIAESPGLEVYTFTFG